MGLIFILRLRPCRRPLISWFGGCIMLFRGFWEAFWRFWKVFGGFWEASGWPRDEFGRSLGSAMSHFGGSLVSSVGNALTSEIHEIRLVFVGFSRVGRHPGGIGRHPGSIWNHLGGIWRQLGGIWRFLGGIWRLLGSRACIWLGWLSSQDPDHTSRWW